MFNIIWKLKKNIINYTNLSSFINISMYHQNAKIYVPTFNGYANYIRCNIITASI
jgi:hypothetical protein